MRIDDHASHFFERDGRQIVGVELHVVNPRDALEQRAFCFGESIIGERDVAKGA